MKICVLNGSPKGDNSITLQTALYLAKRFPQHSFDVVNVGQRITAFEKDMSRPIEAMLNADILLFTYPVYTFLAPSQLHRFIELVKLSGADLSGKVASQITTSKHFYDVTAHRYIEDNCHDLGLNVVHGLSADMEDLTTEKGQRQAEDFFEYLVFCAENSVFEPSQCTKEHSHGYDRAISGDFGGGGYDTVIVADLKPGDTSLSNMIDDFRAAYPYGTRLVNIAEYRFSGGCLGCFNCAGDGKCIRKDGFDSFLRENIQTASAIVYAFTVSDHSMGSRFKTYDDRQFCNGHRTVTSGMPFAYLVNGDYENEQNLRTVIEARCEVGGNFLAGVGFNSETIKSTAARLAYSLEHPMRLPANFYGVGGMKIFRDMIWLMRGLMKADHDYYKKHGVYDFPQKKRGYMIKMMFLGSLIRNKKVKAKMGNKMNEGMIAPYKKVIDAAKPISREK